MLFVKDGTIFVQLMIANDCIHQCQIVCKKWFLIMEIGALIDFFYYIFISFGYHFFSYFLNIFSRSLDIF